MYNIYYAFYKINKHKNKEINISEDKVCYIHKSRLDFHFTYMYRYALDREGSMK